MSAAPPPLTNKNAIGRLVLVPKDLWPDYACDEHGGLGWEAMVIRADRDWAKVNFLHAKDECGREHRDVYLQLSALRPLRDDALSAEQRKERKRQEKEKAHLEHLLSHEAAMDDTGRILRARVARAAI